MSFQSFCLFGSHLLKKLGVLEQLYFPLDRGFAVVCNPSTNCDQSSTSLPSSQSKTQLGTCPPLCCCVNIQKNFEAFLFFFKVSRPVRFPYAHTNRHSIDKTSATTLCYSYAMLIKIRSLVCLRVNPKKQATVFLFNNKHLSLCHIYQPSAIDLRHK